MFIVVSKMKEHYSGKMHSSKDFSAALSAKVGKMLDECMVRALANGRKTVRPCDL